MKQYTNRDWLFEQYITKGLGIFPIAKLCNVSPSIISKYLHRLSIPVRPFQGRGGKNAAAWKGGKIKSNGYIYINAPEHPCRGYRTYIGEHILIAEKAIGRLLTKEERIHHINEVRTDNRLENLYLFPNEREHQRYHQKLRKGSGEPIAKSNLL